MLAKKTSQIGEVEASKYKCGGIYLTIKKWYLENVFDLDSQVQNWTWFLGKFPWLT